MEPEITIAFSFFGILENVNAFLVFFIGIGSALGAFSRKLSIAAYGGFVTFAHISLETDLFIFDAVLYLVLTIVLLWAAREVIGDFLTDRPEGT